MRLKRFIEAEEAGRLPTGSICGVLVHVRPDRHGEAMRGLAALPGVDLHQATADGRLVVTVEDTPTTSAGEVIHRFYEVEGVVSAALVYHYHDRGDLRGEVSA